MHITHFPYVSLVHDKRLHLLCQCLWNRDTFLGNEKGVRPCYVLVWAVSTSVLGCGTCNFRSSDPSGKCICSRHIYLIRIALTKNLLKSEIEHESSRSCCCEDGKHWTVFINRCRICMTHDTALPCSALVRHQQRITLVRELHWFKKMRTDQKPRRERWCKKPTKKQWIWSS